MTPLGPSGIHPRGRTTATEADQRIARLEAELRAAEARAEDLARRLERAEAELAALRGAPAIDDVDGDEVDDSELIPDAHAPPPPLPPSSLPAPARGPVAAGAEAVPVAGAVQPTEEVQTADGPSLDRESIPSRMSMELVDGGAYPTLRDVHVTAGDEAEEADAEPSVAAETARPTSGRRASDRRPCEFHVEFIADTHFISGLSLDVSTGGVFVATYQKLPVGTRLHLSFELPDGNHVEADGEVRWLRSEEGESRPGMGVAFTSLPPESLRRIARFCRKRPPLFFDV